MEIDMKERVALLTLAKDRGTSVLKENYKALCNIVMNYPAEHPPSEKPTVITDEAIAELIASSKAASNIE
jgi:hypothetical protein